MHCQLHLHVNVLLLAVYGHLLPLLMGDGAVNFENFLVESCGQSIHEGLDCLWYIKSIAGHPNEFFKFDYIHVNVFSLHSKAFS